MHSAVFQTQMQQSKDNRDSSFYQNTNGIIGCAHLEEVCVPAGDVVGSLLLVLVVLGRGRVVLVVGGPLDHLLEDGRVHVGQRHQLLLILVHPEVLEMIFDETVCK